jgi:Ca2+-transporting ATPase
MALIRDPAEPNIMRRPPRDPREPLVTWRFGAQMLGEGALLAAGVLSGYLWTVWWHGPGARATTVAFVSVVLIHPFQAMNCRSERYGWWRLPPNRLVWLSLVTLGAVQWMAVSWAPLAGLLHTAPLPGTDWSPSRFAARAGDVGPIPGHRPPAGTLPMRHGLPVDPVNAPLEHAARAPRPAARS